MKVYIVEKTPSTQTGFLMNQMVQTWIWETHKADHYTSTRETAAQAPGGLNHADRSWPSPRNKKTLADFSDCYGDDMYDVCQLIDISLQ